MDQDEEDLLSLLATDLDRHFRQLVLLYQQRLYSFAIRLVGSPQDAEDIVQETFLRTYHALKSYPVLKIRSLRLRQWIYTITLNIFRNHQRKSLHQSIPLDISEDSSLLEIEDPSWGPDEEAYWHEWRRELVIQLATLSERYRVAVTLYYFEDLSYVEIAELLNQPIGTVKARTLGLMSDRVSIELLIRALDDPDWQVREIVILTLGELDDQAPLDPLLAMLNDEHVGVRKAARLALEQSHPEALSAISIDPLMITQESGSDSVFSAREQEQPRTNLEVDDRVKVPSKGDSTMIQLTAHVKTFLSMVVRDVVTPLAATRSTFADEEVSNEIRAQLQPVQIKPRHLRHIAEGILAALIIAGIVASWLVIQQRLHPSQGSDSSPLLAFHGHVSGPAVWSSDSKYLSIVTDSNPTGETVLIWNKATGLVTKHILHALQANPQQNQTFFAPNGKHLAFVELNASNKEGVQVWDIIAWRSILTTYLSSPTGRFNVLWSPDSIRFVIPAEDGTMQVWNVVTGHELASCHVPQVDYLPSISYISPEGKRVLFGYGPQHMYVLDLTTCNLLRLPSTDANSAFWSPQGDRFATNSSTDASMVQVWDAHTGGNLASFHLSAPVSDTGLVWTPDGTHIVTWGDKEVNVLDVATHRIVLKVIPTKIDLLPVWALSPDGRRIASLSGVDTVQIWDAVTGRKLNAYQSPGNSVKVVAWSPDSRTIATGSTNGTVRVWRGDILTETYHSSSSAVLNIAWSPDGKSIAAGDIDGSIWVWKVN